MKKLLILLMIMVCAGCATIKPEFVNELETTNDPIKVVETYKYYFNPGKSCFYPSKDRPYSSSKTDDLRESCYRLIEPNIKFECTKYKRDTSWEEKKYTNQSDECILFRRSKYFHESSVDYFDYKRFLGANSVIKTDEDFLRLVKYYDKIAECNDSTSITSAEKLTCKAQKKQDVHKLAFKKVPCSKLVSQEYKDALKEYGDWFYWAIDHDPNEHVKTLMSVGVPREMAERFYYQPVLSFSEASEEVKGKVDEFGQEHLCVPDNWKEKLHQMGYNIL